MMVDLIVYICASIATVIGAVLSIKKFIIPLIEKIKEHIRLKKIIKKQVLKCASEQHGCSQTKCFDRMSEDIMKHEGAIDALQAGMTSILRDRLIFLIQRAIDKNAITIMEYENIHEMFIAYKQNGGNGVIDQLMEDVSQLKKI